MIHVAVGILRNQEQQVLIALRHPQQHQGGLWEFPGGKVEQGESVADALARELHEELNIEVLRASPALQVSHVYPDKAVLLDVWQVDSFRGEPRGREGQPTAWVAVGQLDACSFPAANVPIVHWLQTQQLSPHQAGPQAHRD